MLHLIGYCLLYHATTFEKDPLNEWRDIRLSQKEKLLVNLRHVHFVNLLFPIMLKNYKKGERADHET